jgi:hypothetical protein
MPWLIVNCPSELTRGATVVAVFDGPAENAM